jgi:predicted nucleotide-binding protein
MSTSPLPMRSSKRERAARLVHQGASSRVWNEMELSRRFPSIRFTDAALRAAINAVNRLSADPGKGKFNALQIDRGDESWRLDSVEEFFSLLPSADAGYFNYEAPLKEEHWRCILDCHLHPRSTTIEVNAKEAHQIHSVMNVFQEAVGSAINLAPPEVHTAPTPPRVFIGHGHSHLWNELKDHLQDKHGFKVVAFETGVRAGHQIRDILEGMLGESSIAFLVLTGEDETADGKIRARQNVVHETGLFQGRLGFSRAIVLLEAGVEELSNLHGIQHISFAKGNIKECFGDVLAVLKREFE